MEKGSVVRLKSGGPPMTVLITDEKTTRCQWFTLLGELEDSTFATETLEDCGAFDFLRTLGAFLDRVEIRHNMWSR